MHNEPLVIPEKIYDIKLFCEDLFSAYPSLTLLEIQDNYTYDENSSTQVSFLVAIWDGKLFEQAVA